MRGSSHPIPEIESRVTFGFRPGGVYLFDPESEACLFRPEGGREVPRRAAAPARGELTGKPVPEADLLIRDAELLVTMTGEEIAGGWVAISDGVVDAVGGRRRRAARARRR